MASFLRIAAISNLKSSSSALLHPPTPLFLCCRGIATKLFVGGLSFATTENGLSEAFSRYGQVIEAKIVTDKVTERSKGFGFVTFASVDEATLALSEMNETALNGRVIYVDIAKPKDNFQKEIPIATGPPQPPS